MGGMDAALAFSQQRDLHRQLAQCEQLLAEAVAHADEPELSSEEAWFYAIVSVLLVIFAGLMAGLTLGLLS